MRVPRTPLAARIASVIGDLSPAQARVARLIDESPSLVAFGTVGEVARAAGTSPQTVLRLADRLGHDGFAALREAVQTELVARLPAAADRIRVHGSGHLLEDVLAADLHNVSAALDGADVEAVVELLADRDRRVGVLAAASWAGVGALLAGQLDQLREGVVLVDGAPPRVARQLAGFDAGDVLVVVDVRRYERWVLAAVEQAVAAGVVVVAVTDAATAPLVRHAEHALSVGVSSPGPFESPTGVVALLHAVSSLVADRLRNHARERLDATEHAWEATGALVED